MTRTENRQFVYGPNEPVEPKLPSCLCWKKTTLIIGCLFNFLKMAFFAVFSAIAVCKSIAEKADISFYWFLPIWTLMALVAAAGELCGLLGTVIERIKLLKLYLVYGVLELAFQVVVILYGIYLYSISKSSSNLSLTCIGKGTECNDNTTTNAFVYYWQSSVVAVFRTLLWYGLVLWFMNDVTYMQKHSL